MRRGNMERTILSCMKCRTSWLPALGSLSRNQSFSGSSRLELERSSKQPRKFKLGSKVYVLKVSESVYSKSERKRGKPEKLNQDTSIKYRENFQKSEHNDEKKNTVATSKNDLKTILRNAKNFGKDGFSMKGEFSHFSILNQPFLHNDGKPVLPYPVPKLTVPVPDNYDSYPNVGHIMVETVSDIASHRLMSKDESFMDRMGIESYTERLEAYKQHREDFKNLLKEYCNNGDDSLAALSPTLEACWESLASVWEDISNPHAIFTPVLHSHLGYYGTADVIGAYRGKPSLIKFKNVLPKNTNSVWAWSDPLMMTVAVAGAANSDVNFPYQIQNVVLVCSAFDGSPALVHQLNLKETQEKWRMWLRRIVHFRQIQNKSKEDFDPNQGGKLRKIDNVITEMSVSQHEDMSNLESRSVHSDINPNQGEKSRKTTNNISEMSVPLQEDTDNLKSRSSHSETNFEGVASNQLGLKSYESKPSLKQVSGVEVQVKDSEVDTDHNVLQTKEQVTGQEEKTSLKSAKQGSLFETFSKIFKF